MRLDKPSLVSCLILSGCVSPQHQPQPDFDLLPASKNRMIFVKGGTFQMGDLAGDGREDEKPHPVTLSDFYMSQYEVTVADFRRFIEDTGYLTEAERKGSALVYFFVDDSTRGWRETPGINWRNPGYDQSDEHPVTTVSWPDAKAFANWLSEKTGRLYRLPTEAEWEYAARNGGEAIKFPWGNSEPTGSESNFADRNTPYPWSADSVDDGYFKAAPVGSYPANGLGLYDMSGNVWEWCEDWYGTYSEAQSTDPTGPPSGEYRIMRGGAWNSRPYATRASSRNYDSSEKRYENLGFRVVVSLGE